ARVACERFFSAGSPAVSARKIGTAASGSTTKNTADSESSENVRASVTGSRTARGARGGGSGGELGRAARAAARLDRDLHRAARALLRRRWRRWRLRQHPVDLADEQEDRERDDQEVDHVLGEEAVVHR